LQPGVLEVLLNATQLSRKFGAAALAVSFAIGLTAAAAAQNPVTDADIQRLQTDISDTARDIGELRSHDASLASQLQNELDDARDEVTYLRVKVRKNEAVTRNDYLDLRDRIDSIHVRARGTSASEGPAPVANTGSRDDRPVSSSRSGSDVPVGTEFDVRLQTPLSSATTQVEDKFEATTLVDYRDGDRVLVPAGSTLRGVVSSVKKAGRIERTGSLTLAFDRLTIGNRSYPIRGVVTDALESEGIKGDAGKIGAGAGVGAVIGAILGGAKGALAGILIGGGGTVAATEGKDVELMPGTVLRVRLDSDLNLR
jgi:hypothetical protein